MLSNRLICTSLCCSILMGCGGASKDDASPGPTTPPPVTSSVSIDAIDKTAAVYVDEPSIIHLNSAVVTSDGSKAVLTRVTPLSNDTQCQNITLGELDFTLTGDNPGSCIYEYEVADAAHTTHAVAHTQVAISGADAPLINSNNLQTLSETIELGEQKTISLVAPDAMTLSNEVTVLGSGVVTDVDIDNNTITYQAGSSEYDAGITRIHYYYSDDDGLIRMGSIDVAVSTDTLNHAPAALNWQYLEQVDADEGLMFTTVAEGDTVEIDITNVVSPTGELVSLISDADAEDSLQLIGVYTVNASATLVAPEDLQNTRFSFSANAQGRYSVTYVVSDHMGGFAIGIIEVVVDDTWDNVLVDETGELFLAPLSLSAALNADISVSGLAGENSPTDNPAGNGVPNVPTYSWDIADAVCISRGARLPTLAEAQAFVTQEGNPYMLGDGNTHEVAQDWPIARPYFTSDFSSSDTNLVSVIDLATGDITEVASGFDTSTPAYLGYLWCIDLTPTTISIANEYLTPHVTEQLEATLETAGGNSALYEGALIWRVDQPENTLLPAVPDITTNVTLDSFTGEFISEEEGFVNIEVSTWNGDLTTKKDIQVTGNLLVSGGASTNWRGLVDNDFGGCENELIASVTYEEISKGLSARGPASNKGYIVHNCSDDLTTPGNNRYYRMQFFAPNVSSTDQSGRGRIILSNDNYMPLKRGVSNYRFTFEAHITNSQLRTTKMSYAASFFTADSGTQYACWVRGDGSGHPSANNDYGTNESVTSLGNNWYRYSCDINNLNVTEDMDYIISVLRTKNANGGGSTGGGDIYIRNVRIETFD